MSNPSDGRIEITGVRLISLTALMLLVFAAGIAMPFNITGIVESFAVDNAAAGLAATVEMAGVAGSSLLFSQLAPRLNPKRVYLVGISAIIVLNVATIWAPTVEVLYIFRALNGISAGAIVATVMSTAGRSTAPEATFGVINSAVGVMGMVLSLVLPQALKFHGIAPQSLSLSPVDGLFFIYLLFAVLALGFIRSVPVPPPIEEPEGGGPVEKPKLPFAGWIALFGLGVVFFGHATLAMFIVNVGVEQVQLSPQTVGFVFMFASAFGIVAPLVAGYVGVRFKAKIPIAVILMALVVFAFLLSQASAPIEFYISGPFFAMMPIALMPIMLGSLARLDPTGRLTGAHPAFVTLGAAIAPVVGGAVSVTGDYSANGLLVVGCTAIGAAFFYPAILIADRKRDEVGSPLLQPAAETESPR
ncbi:MAG: MFS transporter [Alphaproteobacteria bacterium]|nr:MFS transporter [Alphaproteobacteria bacterium]